MAKQWTEEQKKAASEAAKARRAAQSGPGDDGMEARITKNVTTGVMDALKEMGMFPVNPQERPAMGRVNPGVIRSVEGAGHRCKCGLIHDCDEHYGCPIEPGFHYVNVEDSPEQWGLPSDIGPMLGKGYEIAKHVSDKFKVMRIPEDLFFKRLEEQENRSRKRLGERKAEQNLIPGAVEEATYASPGRGSAIHVDLSRMPADAPDSFGGDEDAESDY